MKGSEQPESSHGGNSSGGNGNGGKGGSGITSGQGEGSSHENAPAQASEVQAVGNDGNGQDHGSGHDRQDDSGSAVAVAEIEENGRGLGHDVSEFVHEHQEEAGALAPEVSTFIHEQHIENELEVDRHDHSEDSAGFPDDHPTAEAADLDLGGDAGGNDAGGLDDFGASATGFDLLV